MFGKTSAVDFNPKDTTADGAKPAPYYLPVLIGGIVASIGIMTGSSAVWLQVFVFSATGLDIDDWGKLTLTLGAFSAVALLAIAIRQPSSAGTTSSIRWAAPLACGVFVAGVACLAIASSIIVRFLSTSTVVFDAPSDVEVGWGLWTVAFFSPIVSLAAIIVAPPVGKAGTRTYSPSTASWAATWGWTAVIGSTVIVLCAVGYVWARQTTGYDTSFWLRLFEHVQHLESHARI
jgi:hypothetical protein